MLLFDDGKKLEKAVGEEAAAILQAFERYDETTKKELATKADIQLVRSEMKEMEARLTGLLHKDRVDSIKWIAGMLIAQAAAVAALVRLL